MSNATEAAEKTAQRASLPVVYFRCAEMRATITTRTCTAQYAAANGGGPAKKQAGYTPHGFRTGCVGCAVGKDHSKGKPTPPDLVVEKPTLAVVRPQASAKVCPVCLGPFTPARSQQRYCSASCDPSAPENRRPSVAEIMSPVAQGFVVPESLKDTQVSYVEPTTAPVENNPSFAIRESEKPPDKPETKETAMPSFAKRECAEPECGTTFAPTSARSLYCSQECKRTAINKRYHERRGDAVKTSKGSVKAPRDMTRREVTASRPTWPSRRAPKPSPTAALRAAAADVTGDGSRSMAERILVASGFTVVESLTTPRGRLLIVEEPA